HLGAQRPLLRPTGRKYATWRKSFPIPGSARPEARDSGSPSGLGQEPMRGHFRGQGAARLTTFVAAVVALIVVGGLPAAAADTTPPTLVSFSRTSAPTAAPNQAVTLSYSAS